MSAVAPLCEALQPVLFGEFARFLRDECRYVLVLQKGEGRWVGLHQFAYTWAILEGRIGDQGCYDDRWCFATFDLAVEALARWAHREFQGEPDKWHRHPDTGRRRPEGDASKEYVSP